MRLLSLVAALAAIFAIGWSLGRWSRPEPPSPDGTASRESARESETRGLLEKAAADLRNASSDDEKRQRTDELLENIFKLFLIDVHLRLADAGATKPAPPPAPEPAVAKDTDRQPPPAAPDEPAPAANERDRKREENRRRRFEINVVNAENPRARGKLRGARDVGRPPRNLARAPRTVGR